MRLVALTGGRYHAALADLRRNRWRSSSAPATPASTVSASVSINHVTLNENDIGPYRTFLKLSPPLRTEDDRRALVAAVASGLIDVIMSDHNPQDVEVKRLPFAEAAPGAIGLETMLPAALRLIHQWRDGFQDADPRDVDAACRVAGPARRIAAAGLAGGRDRDRCRHALGARSRRSQIAMQEHARSTKPGFPAAWCAPSSAGERCMSMSHSVFNDAR